MKPLYTYTLAVIIVSLFWLNPLNAQNISVYATPIEEVVKGDELVNQNYNLIEDGVANFDNGLWIAVKLEIPEKQARKGNFIYLSYALLDIVEVWAYHDNNTLQRIHETGQAFNFDSRSYESSDFVFPMMDSVKTYYFKIYSAKPILLPFQILNKKELIKDLTTKDFFFGIYTGIILVMFLYNMVLIFITQDRSYIFYIIYLLTLLLTQLSLFGYTDRFITPNWPSLNQKIAPLSGALVAIAFVFFSVNFLNLRQKSPLFAKLFFLVITLDVFGILFLILDYNVLAFHWINMTSLYESVIALIIGVKLSLGGDKPAKFFLFGWLAFLISVIIFSLMNLDVIAYHPYLHQSMLLGSAIEAILLSVALADRINTLRKEKEDSQAKTLEIARENETIIREQNILLEQKVVLRTQELQSANNELASTLENLNKTQAQLLQSEKMASLGILTAGVAHEINNPLNYIHGGYTAIRNKIEKKKKNINNEDLKEYLKWIKVGVLRATKIVESLSQFGYDSNTVFEKSNLNSIIEKVLNSFQDKLNDNIIIKQSFDHFDLIIQGNQKKLNQAIYNLIENAIDAIEGKGEITITTKRTKKYSFVVIKDDGCGISKEHINKVMDPFFTTKPPGDGTGLGLSIAQSIMKEHDGEITIESEKNIGTKVTLRFMNHNVK